MPRSEAHDRRIALSVTTVGILAVTLNASILLISLPAIFAGLGLDPLAPTNISYLLWMQSRFAAFIDTDLSAHIVDQPKTSPSDIAAVALDGVEAGEFEVLADDVTRTVRAALSGPLSNLYPSLQAT